MPGGRPRKYNTPEEVRIGKLAAKQRFYERNKAAEQIKGRQRAARRAAALKAQKTPSILDNTPPPVVDDSPKPQKKIRLVDSLGLEVVSSKTSLNTAMQELLFIVTRKIQPAKNIHEWMKIQHEKFITYMRDDIGIWRNYRPVVMALLDEISPYKARARELYTEAFRRHLAANLQDHTASSKRNKAYQLCCDMDTLWEGIEEIRLLMDDLGWEGYYEEYSRTRLTFQKSD